MALGCEKNRQGMVHTYEIIASLRDQAIALWDDLGMNERIRTYLQPSLSVQVSEQIDLLFLDSEPQLRFDEFVKFWPNLKPGGIVLIHDLHPSFGHHGKVYHGVYDWPYGDFREKLSSYIKENRVQITSFPTPRGLTMLQKEKSDFLFLDHLKGQF